ncbi:MAG: cyclic nucleotide-binding domain-containing protein [Bacteroidota bacterium]|uniref:cyclic nucleotide-binding domain-containing protein n=1 Tax=Flagellimonas profundi TaxID=2915620 RepID=UPI0028BE27F1|nr:cyclic nucleotide-binding domain-containing protein [Allomuricauda profundi]MEC7769667.1 cyclic nucleotide-binding domain-containing protein [Bacteroidota bacterium]
MNHIEADINYLKEQFPNGTISVYEKGHVICNIHTKVRTFRWLIQGAFDYYTTTKDPEEEVLVCQISEPMSTLGLNGLNDRKRYTYKIAVASERASFYEVPIEKMVHHLENDQNNQTIAKVGRSLYHQLRQALLKQTDLLQAARYRPLQKDQEFFIGPDTEQAEVVSLMRRSPFLDYFDDRQLSQIASIAERREYEPDEVLYIQDRLTNGLFILIHGEVAIKRLEGNIEIRQRSINNPGFIFGWSCAMREKDICSAVTTQKTSIYFIHQKDLLQLLGKCPFFAHKFFMRLLWLMGNQINAAFVRYLGLLGKHNLQAVYQLIENNKSRLALSSPLHQVGHLLSNTNTKQLGYDALSKLINNGSHLERHIASLSLELLQEDMQELKFLKGLQQIYETVAEKKNESGSDVRKSCASATKLAFEHVQHHIEGLDSLPDKSGCIFIYNHLFNHPFYTLNNTFQITLDSHFISAKILDEKYNDPGIRTVRIGRGQEYGHQNYYNKLGYINVYTKESDSVDKRSKKETRSIFYRTAAKYLQNGHNLVISPEGTSYSSEESPGPFKAGVFKLAQSMDHEPYFVPIVLVNFDKRISDGLFYCKIHQPFKLSEKLSETGADVYDFVKGYQHTYASYVEDARKRAEELYMKPVPTVMEEPPEIWRNEIKRLKRRVSGLEDQQDLIVFYGSSSVRLWVGMKKDLDPFNVLNLGFGGSTYAWCIHYFDEIFKGAEPNKIVLYAGENDLAQGKSPQEVLNDCNKLVQMILKKYPEVELAFVSLKPSLEREEMIPQIIETNLLLSKYVIGELNAQYINVFGQMITADNRPKHELYMSDGLHLNKNGYAIWSEVIKTALLSAESPVEKESIDFTTNA